MITVDEALARVLDAFSPLTPIRLPLLDADSLVLAEDISASINLPPFTNSAMDGYAVRAVDTADTRPGHPQHLRVIGQSVPGKPTHVAVSPGCCVRIMTGAPVPDGADAIVRFEDTDEVSLMPSLNRETPYQIAIHRPALPGQNVRLIGEDVIAGEMVLPAGSSVGVAEIGLLASLNQSGVLVHRRPRVAILSTGDELTPSGVPLGPGSIYESNSFALAAMVRRFGGTPRVFGIARDTVDDLKLHLRAATETDFIVTSGGVSVGDYDLVKQVLRAEGAIALWQVRMRPGRPLAFGHLGRTPLLGLPGNPVATIVAFQQFGRPAIRKMLGHSDLVPPAIQARLLQDVENGGGRRNFVRAIVSYDRGGGYVVKPLGKGGSGVLSTLTQANGLLVIPESVPFAEAGKQFAVQLFDSGSVSPLPHLVS